MQRNRRCDLADAYDSIAEQYKRSKEAAWRHHIEQYSLFQLLGDVSGKTVLDLACGEGHYTRLLKALGASRVVGVDLSPKMIALAERTEREQSQGIEYRVGDAREVRFDETFDVVVAAYLLNYAQTKEDLVAMGRAIARSLKPGGRFVTVNNSPRHPWARFASTRKYGFVKTASEEPKDGTTVRYTFFNGEDEVFGVDNYHLDIETHEEALKEAGLSSIEWKDVELAPSEATGPDKSFWDDFFADDPAVILLSCTRASGGSGAAR